MNRGYISTRYTSELILKIKMTSSNVFPAHAVPMMSAVTMTSWEGSSLWTIPHTISYLLACPVSLPSLPSLWESQSELKFLHIAQLLRCPWCWGRMAPWAPLWPPQGRCFVLCVHHHGGLHQDSFPSIAGPWGKDSLDAIIDFMFVFISYCLFCFFSVESWTHTTFGAKWPNFHANFASCLVAPAALVGSDRSSLTLIFPICKMGTIPKSTLTRQLWGSVR